MLEVYCVRWGDRYSPDYVTRLRNMVARNLSEPHQFYCLTDDPLPDVECVAFGDSSASWWRKMQLLETSVERLYIDLDVVIMGSLDPILKYARAQQALAAPRDWLDPKTFNGSVIYIPPGLDHLYQRYLADQDRITKQYFAPQTYLPTVTHINYLPPEMVVSYKFSVLKHEVTPESSRVVCFHGKPDPHEVDAKWVINNWR